MCVHVCVRERESEKVRTNEIENLPATQCWYRIAQASELFLSEFLVTIVGIVGRCTLRYLIRGVSLLCSHSLWLSFRNEFQILFRCFFFVYNRNFHSFLLLAANWHHAPFQINFCVMHERLNNNNNEAKKVSEAKAIANHLLIVLQCLTWIEQFNWANDMKFDCVSVWFPCHRFRKIEMLLRHCYSVTHCK